MPEDSSWQAQSALPVVPDSMTDLSLTAAELEEKLDELLESVLSSRRTAAPLARALAEFERTEQDFALRWVDIIAKTNAEMAYQFCARAPEAFRLMTLAAVEDWIIRAMDVYDKQGLYPGCSIFTQVQNFAVKSPTPRTARHWKRSAACSNCLCAGCRAAGCGWRPGDIAHTDTDMLYLPARLSGFARHADNYRLYKALTAHGWAQTWYGSFRLPEGELLSAHFAAFPIRTRRSSCSMRSKPRGSMPAWRATCPGFIATCRSCKRWPVAGRRRRVGRCRSSGCKNRRRCARQPGAHGRALCRRAAKATLLPRQAVRRACRKTLHERLAREKNALREALTHLGKETTGKPPPGIRCRASRSNASLIPRSPGFRFTLTLDGQPVAPPADVRALMDSILQDLGQIPDEYLVAAGDGGYRRGRGRQAPRGCLERHLPRGRRVSVQRVGSQARALPQALVRAARTRRAPDA